MSSPTLVVGTNTYISLADAKTYFTYQLYSTNWDLASDEQKTKALILACKKIDRQIIVGIKADETQALEFPRALYIYDDFWLDSNVDGQLNMSQNGNWYIESTVAQCVKDAQCQEAEAILRLGTSYSVNKRQDLQSQGVKSFSIGNLSETYSIQSTNRVGKLYSQEAQELIARYTLGSKVII